MNKRILQYLVTLYGRDVAVDVSAKLAELMAQRADGSGRGDAFQLSERDALLITYADQVTELLVDRRWLQRLTPRGVEAAGGEEGGESHQAAAGAV